MAGNANDPAKDKIDKTLKRLGAGRGYSERKLLSAPMLELFPEDWPQMVRAASCDELIREYLPQISDPKDAAATSVALNFTEDYKLPTRQERLIVFGRAWREAHPEDKDLSFDATHDGKTYGAVRKWWYEGRESLGRQVYHEIARRNRTQSWPQPAQATLERFEAAIRSDESSTMDASSDGQTTASVPSDKRRDSQRPRRLYLTALTACLVIMLGISLYFVAWPGQRATGSTTSYATTIEHRYDGHDPQGKDGPGTKCADPPASQPVTQAHPVVVGPSGKVVGYVELRTSPICQVIWARVDWIHGSYTMPPGWALHIQMIRRVHPKMIQYVAYDTSDYVYGNMLATVSGCVYAKVFFADGSQQTPPAQTACMISS